MNGSKERVEGPSGGGEEGGGSREEGAGRRGREEGAGRREQGGGGGRREQGEGLEPTGPESRPGVQPPADHWKSEFSAPLEVSSGVASPPAGNAPVA